MLLKFGGQEGAKAAKHSKRSNYRRHEAMEEKIQYV